MAIKFTVNNTFIDLVEENAEQTEGKRSHSVPRSWKPYSPESCITSRGRWADATDTLMASDVSTVDSDEYASNADPKEVFSSNLSSSDSDEITVPSLGEKINFRLDGLLSSGDSDGAGSEHSGEVISVRLEGLLPSVDNDGSGSEHSGDREKLSLCLCEAIEENTAPKTRTKLQSKARMFESVMSLPRDMNCVLTAAHAALASSPGVFNVKTSDARLGGTTTIIGSYARGSLQVFELVKTLSIVKMMLLDAAANSENTYVMGYQEQPFTQIGQEGFSCKLASVPALQEKMTCWDTFQKGYCPRPRTCRWCHPSEEGMAKVIVMLNEVDSTTG